MAGASAAMRGSATAGASAVARTRPGVTMEGASATTQMRAGVAMAGASAVTRMRAGVREVWAGSGDATSLWLLKRVRAGVLGGTGTRVDLSGVVGARWFCDDLSGVAGTKPSRVAGRVGVSGSTMRVLVTVRVTVFVVSYLVADAPAD